MDKNMFTVLIVAALGALTTSVEAQCPCYLFSDLNMYVCDDPSLTEIPDCVPLDITALGISSPMIPLNYTSIRRFTMLDTFHIAYRDADDLDSDIFYYNHKIINFSVYFSNLEYIEGIFFRNTPNLTALNLEVNKFTALSVDALDLLYNLKYLYLNDNQLTTLSVDHFNGTKNLMEINLDNNPWQCDCQLATLIQWLMDRQIYIYQNATCKYPLHLKDLNLLNLPTGILC